MAATIFRPPITPLPTPLPTPVPTAFLARGPVPRFARRFENGTFTTSSTSSRGPDCASFSAFETCSSSGDYGSCLASTDVAYCNCNNGMQYLECVGAAVTTSACAAALGISDWDAYERGWFQSSCPKPPSSIMTQLEQPTSVQLDLESVPTVTPSGPITEPPPQPLATPTFTPGAELLTGECSSTSYTLLNAGDIVFYAAVVGCDAGRPQCCPWNVTRDEGPGSPAANRAGAVAGEFPDPASPKDGRLPSCPRDYYSVSGKCCPNGYYQFTREIAQRTPCFSSLTRAANPPPITAGLAANPTQSSLPTSAIVNLAIAMSFDVDDPAPGLSQGAIIGIGVGSGIAAIIILAVITLLVRRWRKNKKAARQSQQPMPGASEPPDMQQGMTYPSGYHAPVETHVPPQDVKPVHYGGSHAWDGGYQYGPGYQAPAMQGPHDVDYGGYYRS